MAKHDEVAEALGPTLSECTRAILDTVTMSDLFDCAAGDLVEQRGGIIPHTGDDEPTNADKRAYDVAFFDVLDAVLANLRVTWGGYYNTFKYVRKLHVHCDVIHPESHLVLAEPGDVFVLPNPVAAHILDVAEAHPDHYYTYTDEDGQTLIARAGLPTHKVWQPTDPDQLLRAGKKLGAAINAMRDEEPQ